MLNCCSSLGECESSSYRSIIGTCVDITRESCTFMKTVCACAPKDLEC